MRRRLIWILKFRVGGGSSKGFESTTRLNCPANSFLTQSQFLSEYYAGEVNKETLHDIYLYYYLLFMCLIWTLCKPSSEKSWLRYPCFSINTFSGFLQKTWKENWIISFQDKNDNILIARNAWKTSLYFLTIL